MLIIEKLLNYLLLNIKLWFLCDEEKSFIIGEKKLFLVIELV